MEFVIGVLALFFVLCVIFGVMLTVRAARAVRQGVERTGSQVRRTVEETSLKAKSAQPGPVGQVARLRLDLRTSIDHTREVLEAGEGEDPSLREALDLLDRLHEHARQLDGELRLLMEREPQRARIAERLPEARERVASIKDSADSLRFAAQERARHYDTTGSLDALREQIDVESGALRGWQDPPQPGATRSGGAQPAAPGESTGEDVRGSNPAASGDDSATNGERGAAEEPAALPRAQEPTLPDAVSEALDPRRRWGADTDTEPSRTRHDLHKEHHDRER